MTSLSTLPEVAPDPQRDAARGVLSRATAALSVPNAAPADSFVLHAPLELMARVQLLPLSMSPG